MKALTTKFLLCILVGISGACYAGDKPDDQTDDNAVHEAMRLNQPKFGGDTSTSDGSDSVDQNCIGKMFMPTSDNDWNLMYPITMMGSETNSSSNYNPLLMKMMPSSSECSTVMTEGEPVYCMTSSWWSGRYLTETEYRPGCMSSMGGGTNFLKNYGSLASEKSSGSGYYNAGVNRMQVHMYEYDLNMDLFDESSCKNPTSSGVDYFTEVDPLWQNDQWSVVISTPEAFVVNTPPFAISCAVDTIAAALGQPLDLMFWCAGNWGTLYPFTGNTSHSGQDYAENHLIVAKFVALMQRRGSIMFTIGPSNVCNSSSSPVVIKDQYRFQQIAPVVRKGRAVVFGDPGYFQTPAVSNAPTREYTNNYIYQGRQCCDRNF